MSGSVNRAKFFVIIKGKQHALTMYEKSTVTRYTFILFCDSNIFIGALTVDILEINLYFSV